MGFFDFDASTQGVTTVPRRVGPVEVDVYVTTAAGDSWVVKQPRARQHWNQLIFASGLSDPNGMAFLPLALATMTFPILPNNAQFVRNSAYLFALGAA